MKVRFLESPTGVFGLAYFVGDSATVSKEQGQLLIESGIAEMVGTKEPEQEEAPAPAKPEKAEQHHKRGRRK